MTPWPADVQASFNFSPTTSPMQQSDQDPFAASFGAGPGVPQLNNQSQAPDQQQQPPQQQQGGNVDPWATMMPNAAQTQEMAPPPAQAPPAPAMAPPPAGVVPGPTMAPTTLNAPATAPSSDVFGAPQPPTMVVADSGNLSPPSPMGDVSVLAAAGLGNNNNAAAGPNVPNGMQMNGMQQQQPLQPVAEPTVHMDPTAQAPAPVLAPANPFDFGPVAAAVPQAPPPANGPPQAPPSPPQADQQQPQQQLQQQIVSPPISPTQSNSFAPQSTNYADPFGYAFTPMTSPVTSPVTSPNTSPGGTNKAAGHGALVQSNAVNADPFGVQGAQPVAQVQAPAGVPPSIPNFGAPQQQPTQVPNTQAVVPNAAPNADPFGVFGSQPASAPAANPFGSSALAVSGQSASAGGAVDDPFGIFGTPAPVAAPQPAPAPAFAQQQAPAPQEEDPWAAAGFGQAAPSYQHVNSRPDPQMQQVTSTPSIQTDTTTESKQGEIEDDGIPIALDSNGLPDEGEYYEARINARSLGAMFYTAQNLEETLYHKVPKKVITALDSRPVVAYVAEQSAAHNSGIELGHIILSVNGQNTADPETCAQMIRNAPRPMNLRCYVPPAMNLTLDEGTHLVKYDTKDLEAPGSSVEWKRKYVVVGGIVTKPWMMNMFYRKRDYDIAVKEAHAGHKISVKVKQFDLRGARIILKGRDGKPNWVDYPSERKPWYYITILPRKGYPIKISSESLDELEPVYSAVRRFVRKDMEARQEYQMGRSSYNNNYGSRKGSGSDVRSSYNNYGGSNNYGGRKGSGSDVFGQRNDYFR